MEREERIYMGRGLFLIFLLFPCFCYIYSESEESDIAKFLEKIRQTIQKITSQDKRAKRVGKNKEIAKSKTRKKLIGKFSNPFVQFKKAHSVINYEKKPLLESSNVNNSGKMFSGAQSSGENTNIESSSYKTSSVNKKFMDALMPLKVPSLNELLKRLKSSSKSGEQDKNASEEIKEEGVGEDLGEWTRNAINWFLEATKGARMFWSLVYSQLQQNSDGYEYLRGQECKDEFMENYSIFMSSIEVSGVSLDNVMLSLSGVLSYYYDGINGYKYAINKDMEFTNDADSIVILPQLKEKSLCYNLVALDRYGLKKIKKLGYDLVWCLACYQRAFLRGKPITDESEKKGKLMMCSSNAGAFCQNPQSLTREFKKFKNEMVDYYKRMKWIFEKKLLPTLINMIKKQPSQQFSQEENTIKLIWQLLKSDIYFPFMTSLSKLVSFKNDLERWGGGICEKMQGDFKIILSNGIRENIIKEQDQLEDIKNKIFQLESKGETPVYLYEKFIKLVENVKKELIPLKEALIQLWQKESAKIASLNDLKCVFQSFDALINRINSGNKNVLELSFNNLISLVKEELGETLKKLADQVETVENVTEWLDVGMVLKNTAYELKDIVGSDSGPKTKGLSKFIKIVGGYDIFYAGLQGALNWTITDFFRWLSAFDYSIYMLTAAYNSLRCVINNITIDDFLNYMMARLKITFEDLDFLKCFIGKRETIKECVGELYIIVSIIDAIIGKVEIDSLSNLKDNIENLKKSEEGGHRWGDIPAMKDCCGENCKDVSMYVKGWCLALTSRLFGQCCNVGVGLGKCCDYISQQGCNLSEPFCLSDAPNTVKRKCCEGNGQECSPDLLSLSRFGIGAPCENPALLLSTLLAITYNGKNGERKIFCDIIENYNGFCNDRAGFINKIKDGNGINVMANAGYWESSGKAQVFVKYGELKCECTKCTGVTESLCNLSISIDYSVRSKIEEFIKKIGLWGEAQKSIEGGLSKNLGQCPFK